MKNNHELIVRCSKCDFINKWAPMGAKAENGHPYNKCCPRCGAISPWQNSIERWVSTAKWWDPKTWLNGYWEKKL